MESTQANPMVQITIIGAGSIVFSADLLRDLCLTKSLSGSTVALMDIDKDRLAMVLDFAKRYMKETNADLRFKVTTSRRNALEDADFVICSVKVGGYKGMEAERSIAGRYGYNGGIGDRVSDYYGGIGAYHQLRFFLDLAEDMEKLCPNAWLIETANPVFEGTTLIGRETRIRVIGVCHGHFGYERIVDSLRLNPEDVQARIAGFNHCIWMTQFLNKGRDAYPLIDRWIENNAQEYWKSEAYLEAKLPWETEQLSPAAVDMYQMYGLFPIGDTVRSVSPWWYHTDLKTKKRWFGPTGGFDSKVGWSTYLKVREGEWKRMQELFRNRSAPLTDSYPPGMSGEQHIPIIDAIANDKETILQLNVPNGDSIIGIPDDVSVEIPVVVNGRGIRGITIGRLPQRLMLGVMIPRILRMEMILQAFLDGDRKGLLLTLLEDHRAKSLEKSRELLEELLRQPWNSQASDHYKWSK